MVSTWFMELPVVGLITWVLLCIFGRGELGVISIVFLSGPLIAVPLALPFVRGEVAVGAGVSRALRVTWAIGCLSLVGSFLVSGSFATALALPWVTFALVLFAISGLDAVAWRQTPSGAVRVIASAYLFVGASWLLASRAGLTPLGFYEPIVELTAAHFHFAGFGAAVIAATVADALEKTSHRRAGQAAAIAVVIAPVVVAVGHLTAPVIELLGGAVTTAALFLLAYATWLSPVRKRQARFLVRLCSFIVMLPMALALQYGWGRVTGTQALSYETLAAIHGSMNALGFVCGSLFGWQIEE